MIEQVDDQVDDLIKVVQELDEWSKELEVKSRRLTNVKKP